MTYDSLERCKVVILRGMSGSGKTTIARDIQHSVGGEIINRDTIRERLIGSENMERYFEQGLDYSVEEEVSKIEAYEIARTLKRGQRAIVDNTHLRLKHAAKVYRIAFDCGVGENEICVITAPTIPVDEAYGRIVCRGKNIVAREVLEKQFQTMSTGLWTTSEAMASASLMPSQDWHLPRFMVEKYTPDTTKPKAFLFDLDGTLASRTLLTEPRIHYRSFYDYEAVETDKANESLVTIIRAIQCLNKAHPEDAIDIIFVSGRKKDARTATEQFLDNLPIGLYKLFMRDPEVDNHNGKDDSDDWVKYRLFNENIRNEYNVLGVFDDRKKVVALWEELGLQVFNVGKLNEEF